MHARLLAIADDIDPGILLELHGQDRCVEFRLLERRPGELPGCPEPFGLRKPDRLWKASRDRGVKHPLPPDGCPDRLHGVLLASRDTPH